jgi:hypothetical protein
MHAPKMKIPFLSGFRVTFLALSLGLVPGASFMAQTYAFTPES